MSHIKPSKGKCIICNEINPECEDKYIYSGKCIVGPYFHYQRSKASIYTERKKLKQVKPIDAIISLQKTQKSKSKEKTLPQLLDLAQKVFNEYIRKRDLQDGRFKCISCGESKEIDQMNAGHYYSMGNHSYLRFNENNVHGQCIQCNCFMHGHLINYRENLIKKIGIEEVEKLDAWRNFSMKWDKAQAIGIIQVYKEKIKELKFDFSD